MCAGGILWLGMKRPAPSQQQRPRKAVSPCRCRDLAGTLKALHNDLELLLLRPAPSPACVHHLKPLDLGAAPITVHRDRFLVPKPLRKAAAAGGVPSDWPVCSTTETATPHRMGAALTYARRYALFALVGIAGEDDLDAPDLSAEPPPEMPDPTSPEEAPRTNRKTRNGTIHKPRQPKPVLAAGPSAILRDQLLAELQSRKGDDDLASGPTHLPAKKYPHG